MQIVKESTTPQCVAIRLENWENYFLIGAYPIARNTGKYRWVEGGKPFRLAIRTDNPHADFSALESGKKTLQDMSAQYWDGKKAMYYMGIINEYQEA